MTKINLGEVKTPTFKVAIDGPAGAGKTTLAKAIAKSTDLVCVDTGALYRAVGLGVLSNNIEPDDEKSITRLLNNGDITVGVYFDDKGQHTILDNIELGDEIRTSDVAMYASKTSALPVVREYLLKAQQAIAEDYNVVMEGRDIGSVVLPNADIKIFLTASVSCRVNRRHVELAKRGEIVTWGDVQKDILQRDHQDSTRKIAPLKQNPEHIVIDTTNMDIDTMVQTVCNIIKTVRGVA